MSIRSSEEGRVSKPNFSASSPPERTGAPCVPYYELLHRIGGGSYGEVWLARNVMGPYRAVKVVPFEREFAGIKRFEPISRVHESQVDILHVGRNGECFYYVMELADDQTRGQHILPDGYVPKTLRSEIARCGKLSYEDCLKIALLLTTALEHIHQHGLVHRDIKPSNIIFVDGAPKLADIGLVTGVEGTRSYVGTEGYIPPEGLGTPQADLYSLGKVLYEIITGKDRQDFPEPPLLDDGSVEERAFLEFQEVLLKSCETDPRRRYQSAREMRADLELLQGGKSVKRLRLLERRLALLTRSGIIAASLLVFVAGAYLFRAHEARTAVREAQRADREAARARLAEQDSREKLREAWLAQAQARRRSGRVGRRFESLEALRKAAAIRPSVELRNEAIACLALADLRTAREWPGNPPGTTLVAFDSTYDRYARANDKGEISVRRVADDQEELFLPGTGVPAEGTLQFSPDNQFLAACYGADASRLKVWSLLRKEAILAPAVSCRACDFSYDGKSIAVAQQSGPISVYDLAADMPVHLLPQPARVYSLRFRPAANHLAVSFDSDPMVQIRDVETGVLVQSLSHPRPVRGLAWNSDGKLLATACADRNAYVWDVATGRMLTAFVGHQGEVIQVLFKNHDALLATFAWDGTLRLWDVVSGRQLVSKPMRGGSSQSSTDGGWLAHLADQAKLVLCEAVQGGECRALRTDPSVPGSSYSCEFAFDGRWAASTHRDGVHFWDLSAASQIGYLPERDASCALLHPGNARLFTASATGVKQWPVETSTDGQVRFGAPQRFGPRAFVERFSLTRDGKTLAFTRQGVIHLFETETAREILNLHAAFPVVFSALSPDGRFAAGCNWPASTVSVWETASGEIIQELSAAKVTYIAFSPAGNWLVTSSDEEYRFWDCSSWKYRYSIQRSDAGELRGSVAFTRDDRLAAISWSRQSLRLIDPLSGHELATVEMPDPQVILWSSFSPDGSQLLVSGRTPVIYLWNLRLIRPQLASLNLDWD